MRRRRYFLSSTAACAYGLGVFLTGSTAASAQSVETREVRADEITVTARRREENVQNVPDAVTTFSSGKLESAGIRSVSGFMDLVPNLNFRNGASFRKGDLRISMRGIGSGQEGWPPVTFLVDGVPAGSLDVINVGALDDIERIEVLRGPQSALYGAGAIAGAINVITQKPGNEFRLKARAAYAKGNDKSVNALVSGPIVEDKLLFQLRGGFRDSDGLIDSASNDLDLDFENQKSVSGRLVFTPQDNFEIDLRAEYVREENGSTYQPKLASPDLIEVFNETTEPRRGFAGEDKRELLNLALKVEWDLNALSVISTTGYNELDQEVTSSACWDDPDNPAIDIDPLTPGGQVGCLFGTAFGSAAAPGQPVDNLFNSLDNFNTFTQDLRLLSPSDQRVRWLVGASILSRDTLTGFDASLILAPDDSLLTLFPAWHAKEDFWWGVYGQASVDVTDRLELTFAGRYDKNEYKDTQYTDRTESVVIPVPDEMGMLIPTQTEKEGSFQPKIQLSYDVADNFMVYATWSKGFRAGFFNTGAFTLPEKTTNYELGAKSTLLDKRLILNTAVFHIDYSDQQFSTVINMPPFRIPVTIPKTNINGAELETTLFVTPQLSFSGGVGYLDSELAGGGRSPIAPKWTANLAADFSYPLGEDWNATFHGDYRYNSSMYLGQDQTSLIDSKSFLNLRAGVENGNWSVVGFVANALNTRQAEMEISFLAGGYIPPINKPRSYGVEVRYSF